MKEATLSDVFNYASRSRDDIWRYAKNMGREPKIYLHWSAGYYNTTFDDYHINIKGDGTIIVTTLDFAKVTAGTWKRNSGALNMSLCCGYGANTNSLGLYPPTAKQIEVMAQCIVEVCEGFWLTIDKGHVLTHGEAADNVDGLWVHEPYGPLHGCERWDLEYLGTKESPKYNPFATNGTRGGDILRGKAIWYLNKRNGIVQL